MFRPCSRHVRYRSASNASSGKVYAVDGGTKSLPVRRLPNGIEAVDDVEDRLPVAPELVGDGRCSFAAIGCEQDLNSSQDKGVLGA